MAQLADHPGHLLAQLRDLLLLRGVAGAGREVVDEVAERGHVLGDAVVDLARDPLALLARRLVAHPAEQQRRLELNGVAARAGCAGPGRFADSMLRSVSSTRTAIISSLAISGIATCRSRSIIASYSQHRAESSSAQAIVVGPRCRPRSRSGVICTGGGT